MTAFLGLQKHAQTSNDFFIAVGLAIRALLQDVLPAPDYRSWPPLRLHVAFTSRDPANDRDRLLAAGATLEEDVVTTPAGDELCMLRDPFGLCVQLCRRRSAIRR